jgi:virginiamycin B lyase
MAPLDALGREHMQTKTWLLSTAAILALAGASPAFAAGAALTGTVTSAKEGAMEGVLVTAKKDGANMSVTVVSDAAGRYGFPEGRLTPGHYSLKVRAVGYVLDGPRDVTVGAAAATANLKLNTTANMAPQLTNSEWLMSIPGTEQEKRGIAGCGSCHTLTLPLSSTYTKEQLASDVLPRMGLMSSQAFPRAVQTRVVESGRARAAEATERLAAYIATVNLSATPQWKFALKPAPRPQGEATRVIITTYDLPRKSMQPHDAMRDAEGYVWISNFGENSLSKLDPKTGVVKEFTYPATRGEGYANGNLDVEFDRDGNVWLGLMNQTGVARFDRKTEKFTFYHLPEQMRDDRSQQAMVSPTHAHVDGKVWMNDAEHPTIARMDVKTGKFDPWFTPFKDMAGNERHGAYGLHTDSQNNAWLLDFPSQYIWKVDAKTGVSTAFKTPTEDSRPRRGRMDSQDRLWFAEWGVSRVAMLDTRTGKFTEWKVPGNYIAPYDANIDKDGWIWTNNMEDDRVTRINAESGKTIQYLMPVETNGRRISVDDSEPRPVLWVGANHQAAIMKVEPLQ